MTRHHPDSLSLMEYSAGNLSEPHALCIKLHLDKCSHCRSRVDTLDSLGAVMMEQQPKVTVSESMFDNILSKIDSEPSVEPAAPAVPRVSALQKLLGEDLNSLPWKRQLGDVSVLDITDRFPGQKSRLFSKNSLQAGKLRHTPIVARKQPSFCRAHLLTRKVCSISGTRGIDRRRRAQAGSGWL